MLIVSEQKIILFYLVLRMSVGKAAVQICLCTMNDIYKISSVDKILSHRKETRTCMFKSFKTCLLFLSLSNINVIVSVIPSIFFKRFINTIIAIIFFNSLNNPNLQQ